MQVILLQDVERVGHEGDVMNVANGYARNYLLPRGIAVKATPGSLQDLELRQSSIKARDAEKRDKAAELAQHLAEQLVEVKATVGEGKRLHGQVTTQHVADAVKAQLDFVIDRRDIEIAEPIRELGEYLLSVRLYKDVRAQLPITVISDGKHDEQMPEYAPKAQPAAQDAAEAAEEIVWDTDAAAEEPAAE